MEVMKTIYVMLMLTTGPEVPSRWAVVAFYPTMAACEADKANPHHQGLVELRCAEATWL